MPTPAGQPSWGSSASSACASSSCPASTAMSASTVASSPASDALTASRTTGWIKQGRVVGGQHLGSNEGGGQAHRLRHREARDRRRMAHLAAIPSVASACARASAFRIHGSHPRQAPPTDRTASAGQHLGRIELGERAGRVELDGAQQLGQVQRIAARRQPRRVAQRVARPAADRGADDRADGAGVQQPRTERARGLRAQRRERRPRRRMPAGRSATISAIAGPSRRGARIGQPSKRGLIGRARRRPRSEAAGRRRGWRSASTDRAGRRTTCRTPASRRALPDSGGAPRRPRRQAERLALAAAPARSPGAARTADARRRTRSPLELRATRAEDVPSEPGRPPARRREQRRLPDPARPSTTSNPPRPAAPPPRPARARARAARPRRQL